MCQGGKINPESLVYYKEVVDLIIKPKSAMGLILRSSLPLMTENENVQFHELIRKKVKQSFKVFPMYSFDNRATDKFYSVIYSKSYDKVMESRNLRISGIARRNMNLDR